MRNALFIQPMPSRFVPDQLDLRQNFLLYHIERLQPLIHERLQRFLQLSKRIMQWDHERTLEIGCPRGKWPTYRLA